MDRALVGLAALVVAATPLVTFAQQRQTLRDRDPSLSGAKKIASDLEQANMRYGAFYLWSRLHLSQGGLSDTNSATVSNGEVSLPTLNDVGLRLTVDAPQRLYFVPHRKTIFTVDFNPSYSLLGHGEENGQLNYLARADAHFLFNHLYLDVYHQRADQLRAHVADINRLATTRENESGVSGEWKYSSKTSGIFTVRERESEYPLDRLQPDLQPDTNFNPVTLLDRTDRSARVAMHHRTFPRTSLFIAGERSEHSFVRATYKDSSRTWYGGGFEFQTGRTLFRAEAGPLKLDFDDPLQPDYTGVTGGIEVTRASKRLTTYASVHRDVGFSIYLDNNYFEALQGTAGVTYVASRKLSLNARIAAERDDYDTPVDGHVRRDTTTFTSAGFDYGFRRFKFGGDVGWYERDSTYDGDVDSGIRYVLRLSLNL